MLTLQITIAILLLISIILLCKSVNKNEWYSQNHYPSESGWYEVQDLETEKIQEIHYSIHLGSWTFSEFKPQPKHFKWRKLND